VEKIKVVIIDDEQHARTVLKKLLEMKFPDVEVAGEGQSLPEAVDLIYKMKPELVFLDIEMPKYSGLQINDFIKNNNDFEIIFVTAYNQYAINAIRISAFDYLLKPVQIDELTEAMKRFMKKTEMKSEKETKNRLDILQENLKTSSPKKLVIQTHQGIHYFEMENILYLEASGMYTIVHSKDGQFVASKPLKDFETLLGINYFRIHRSYIVNCNFITKISNKDGSYVTLNDGSALPISRIKKDDFSEFLLKFQ
jgi:two-component system, LytTR family, response regulator